MRTNTDEFSTFQQRRRDRHRIDVLRAEIREFEGLAACANDPTRARGHLAELRAEVKELEKTAYANCSCSRGGNAITCECREAR